MGHEYKKLRDDGLDFLGKMDGLWRMVLLYLTRKQLTRNAVFFFTGRLSEQQASQRNLQ